MKPLLTLLRAFCASVANQSFFSASSSALSATRRLNFFLLTALSFAGCTSPSASKNSPAKPLESDVVTTFDDAEHALRLTYPGDWEEVNSEAKPAHVILLLAPPSHDPEAKFQPMVAVLAQDSETPVTVADLAGMQARTIEKQKNELINFKLINASAASVGGEPARRLICTGIKVAQPVQAMYILTAHNGQPFAISLIASPDEFSTQRIAVEKMVESAQWAR